MDNESGAIVILTAIMLTMLLGFAALSIDTGHLMVAKNELQNAADAGALAGAGELYNDDGSVIQITCNQTAYDAATSNLSEKSAVEVTWDINAADDNDHDVQRGHWSWGLGTLARGFYANSSTTPTVLYNVTDIALDQDPTFINAVQVVTRREQVTIKSFFAKIFGHDSFQQTATAVGYIGFAGTFLPGELDIPIALCEEFLGTPYQCGVAVLYEHAENAMWTNMLQPDKEEDGTYLACNSADEPELASAVANGNTETLYTGIDVGVNNGIVSAAVKDLIEKWEANTQVEGDPGARKIWEVTLPVIQCLDENGHEENTCAKLVGGVNVQILWMTKKKNNEGYAKTPFRYYEADDADGNPGNLIFTSTTADDYARWNEFATDDDINLVDDGTPLQLELNQLYFRASCEDAGLTGGPGGPNYGTLAKRPVLVN